MYVLDSDGGARADRFREWEALLEAGLAVERCRQVSVPTVLLTGTVTEGHPSFATKTLEATLPDARIVLLDGQAQFGPSDGAGARRGRGHRFAARDALITDVAALPATSLLHPTVRCAARR